MRASLWPVSPALGHWVPSLGFFPPAAVCSQGSGRGSSTSAPSTPWAQTMHLHFSSDEIIPPRHLPQPFSPPHLLFLPTQTKVWAPSCIHSTHSDCSLRPVQPSKSHPNPWRVVLQLSLIPKLSKQRTLGTRKRMDEDFTVSMMRLEQPIFFSPDGTGTRSPEFITP